MAPTKTRTPIGAVAVMLLLLTVGVGCTDGDRSPHTTTASTSTQPDTTTTQTLRATADEAFAKSNDALQRGGQREQWTVLKSYAEPTCASILDNLITQFSSGTESREPSTIVSLTETGDRGVVVSKTATGSPETMHWVRQGGTWKFTCEGMFG